MSQVLDRLTETAGDRLSIRVIFATLGDHSLSLMVLLLALPNCIPMPPPIATFSSLILFFVAVQIAMGRQSLWMPDAVLRQSIDKSALDVAIRKARPWVLRLEAISRPRLNLVRPQVAAPLIGLVVAVLAVGMFTAAPVVGQVPFGLSIGLIGLALVERDGLLFVAGLLMGALGFAISASFVLAILAALHGLF